EVNGEVVREAIPTLQGNYMDFFDGVYEAIRHGKPLPVTAQQGINTIRVIEAAFQSSNQKRVVDL
ncbi:MAG TPA: Gfo/Idh/MocA family oxidoreductase, partial [Flavisolibacter sp.]|nr:Gfo/Idh/MocA family oxidoreductase [Flavisolibacter sp.]